MVLYILSQTAHLRAFLIKKKRKFILAHDGAPYYAKKNVQLEWNNKEMPQFFIIAISAE